MREHPIRRGERVVIGRGHADHGQWAVVLAATRTLAYWVDEPVASRAGETLRLHVKLDDGRMLHVNEQEVIRDRP